MNTPFRAICEAAAVDWEVPALVAGTSVGGETEIVSVGCNPETRFRIASVTKPMTAALALTLLELEEPTGVWPGDVRVRHILSHTSGFDCELPGGDYARFGTGDDALGRCIAELPPLRRFVGCEEIWSYANTGYWLAGHLAAERSGGTFEEALAALVLEPAGLDSTSFEEPDLPGNGTDLPPTPYPRARRPSGGLTSTVADVLRFGDWLLSARVFASMCTVHGKPNRGVYGLGLFGERVAGVEVWGHSGSYGGFTSSFLTVPARDAVFVGLTNSELGTKALRSVEDAFFERAVGARRAQARFVQLDAAQYERFAGTYANSDATYVVERSPAGDGVVVHVNGEELAGLAIDERRFQVPAGPHVGERFDFPRDGFARIGSRLAARIA